MSNCIRCADEIIVGERVIYLPIGRYPYPQEESKEIMHLRCFRDGVGFVGQYQENTMVTTLRDAVLVDTQAKYMLRVASNGWAKRLGSARPSNVAIRCLVGLKKYINRHFDEALAPLSSTAGTCVINNESGDLLFQVNLMMSCDWSELEGIIREFLDDENALVEIVDAKSSPVSYDAAIEPQNRWEVIGNMVKESDSLVQ